MTPPPQKSGRLRELLKVLTPPRQWRIPVFFLMSVGLALSALTLHISNATSYLSDDPKACVNCHVMNPQYATWERSSHANVTNCNDCHVPHDSTVKKYAFKAMDGTRHAFMFTFHLEPQVIQVHEAGQKVIQQNCIRCHEQTLTAFTYNAAVSLEDTHHGRGKLCWDCHTETPHGSVHSLSSAPYARTPILDTPLPAWLAEQLSNQEEQ